ncbi:hypothetical protein JCM10207_006336 [Rhodosporidiobolus poonsookiae]
MATFDLATPRPHRFSLPPSFSPSHRRRQRRSSQPSFPPPSADKQLPPIPFASPPFMPMYTPSPSAMPAKLVKSPSSPRPGRSKDEDASFSSTNSSPSRPSQPPSPKHVQTPLAWRESSRFRRKLGRLAGASRENELDFGCAGEWSDGPADMGDHFYSQYPGGVNRASTSSSVDIPSLTHSRGPSTSSDFSISTAASSVPPSPTFGCHSEPAAPLSPYTSRVPLTPRTAQRKRQSDENAAVDALDEYFTRVRLSQIKEDVSPRGSLSASTVRSSIGAVSQAPTTFITDEPVPSAPAGLAIFGASDGEIRFEAPRRSSTLHPGKDRRHSRSVSHDLELEFIETGHTTFTPITAAPDAHHFGATFLLPESEAFVFPSVSNFASPAAASTFSASNSAESGDSSTTRASMTTDESGSTVVQHRSPVPEHDIGPTLDELSLYFNSSSESSASSTPSPPLIRHQHHASLPSLLPPAPISPLRKHSARFGSAPSSPRLGAPATSRHAKRQSASFAAAHRARLVAAGQASPTPIERFVHYDWI